MTDKQHERPVHQHGQTGLLGEMADCLIGAEAMHHGLGWDNSPPTLYQMFRQPNPKGSKPYGAVVMALGTGDAHPREELAAVARALASPWCPSLLAPIYEYPPLATILVMEAWLRTVEFTTWEQEAAERAGRMIADIPGSKEIRMGLAVMGDVLLTVNRVRGEEPLFTRCDEDPADPAWGGAMMEPLRALSSAARAAYEEAR